MTSPRRNHEFTLLITKSDPASFPEQSSLVHGIKRYLNCPCMPSVLHYLPGWLHYFTCLDEITFCENDKLVPQVSVIFLLRKYHIKLFHPWKNWKALTTYLLIFCKLRKKKKLVATASMRQMFHCIWRRLTKFPPQAHSSSAWDMPYRLLFLLWAAQNQYTPTAQLALCVLWSPKPDF